MSDADESETSQSRTLSSFKKVSILASLFVAWHFVMPSGQANAAVTAIGDFFPDPLVENVTVGIGQTAYGALRIDEGSVFASQGFELGSSTTGFGLATVTGAGSIWTVIGGTVGSNGGFGQLEIRDGGVVNSSQGSFRIGGSTTAGRGNVIVAGANSLLSVGAPFHIGDFGTTGLLEISDQAIVNVPNQQATVGENGRVVLDHGLLRTRGLDNRGVITGTGEIDTSANDSLQNTGRVEVRANDVMKISSGVFSNGFFNSGEVLIDGGRLEIPSGVSNDGFGSPRGTISLRNAEFRAGITGGGNEWQLLNRGFLTFFGGESHLHGVIRNESNGFIAVANESLAVFHDLVMNQSNATISVSPDSEVLFLKGLQMSGGTLLADITGLEGFGHVEVVGQAQLFGSLQIHLADGYEPQAGDSFELLTASGGVNGFLNLHPTSDLPDDLEWSLEFGTHSVVLSVVAPLEGDYNGDGTVDAADYTVWRNWYGTDYTAADGDHSGMVDEGDYGVWKANYGNSSGSGNGGIAFAVPEPANLVAFAMGLLALIIRRRSFSMGG